MISASFIHQYHLDYYMKYYIKSGYVSTGGSETRLGALSYTFTPSPDAADLSMAAMTADLSRLTVCEGFEFMLESSLGDSEPFRALITGWSPYMNYYKKLVHASRLAEVILAQVPIRVPTIPLSSW
jgi:hypothetical protein